MKKQIILITDANAAPAIELFESLTAAGISVSVHEFDDARTLVDDFSQVAPDPLAVLYEIPTDADSRDLGQVANYAQKLWPELALVACRREMSKPGPGGRARLDNPALKRLGFRAIADSPSQLPALPGRSPENPIDFSPCWQLPRRVHS